MIPTIKKDMHETMYETNTQRKFRFIIDTAKNCHIYPGCIWTMYCSCPNCIRFETNIKKYNDVDKT